MCRVVAGRCNPNSAALTRGHAKVFEVQRKKEGKTRGEAVRKGAWGEKAFAGPCHWEEPGSVLSETADNREFAGQ